jgi:hypothetical protein
MEERHTARGGAPPTGPAPAERERDSGAGLGPKDLLASKGVPMAGAVLVLAGLYLVSRRNYLLFHSLAELFSIVVACSIFVIVWNTRRLLDNSYLLFIGVAYLFVAALDLLHTLAYKGMGVFPWAETNLPTQLWIAARYLESLSLLVASFFIGRKLKVHLLLVGYSAVFGVAVLSIFYWGVFPVCFFEATGLTPFKKVSEYVLCGILLASIVQLLRHRAQFEPRVLGLVAASIAGTIASEFAFTLYEHA